MTDTSFFDFKKVVIADVENAESQRRMVIRRRREAERYIVEQQRRQLEEEFARRQAEREHELRLEVATRERLRRRKQTRFAHEEAQTRAHNALLFFTVKKINLLKQFDETLKKPILDEIHRDLRKETFLVMVYQKMGHHVSTITDILALNERRSLEVLKESLEKELKLSPLARKYFSIIVALHLQPRPRRAIDDVLDLTRTLVRGFKSI